MSEVFLLGHPVSHSLSPAMHNAAFKALGLPHKYSTRDVAPEKLADVVASLRGETALGANVTIPHKENALRLMDSAAEEARRVGAVNTIVRRGSRLVGENTDKHGFLRAVQAMRGSSDDDLRIGAALVLGAGGAARACILALLENGNDVLVANRERSRAEELARAMTPYAASGARVSVVDLPRPGAALGVACVVNATPLGMHGEDPLEGVDLPACVVDLVPITEETPLVSRARRSQHVAVVVDGLLMLLHQAARSFELWTGASAPLEAMRAALPRRV